MPSNNLVIITPALSGGGIEKSTPILIEALSNITKSPVIWIGINESTFEGTLPQTTVICAGRQSKDGVLATIQSLLRISRHISKVRDPLLLINGEVAELFAAFFVWNSKMICVEHASQPWIRSRILGRVVRFVLKIRSVCWVTVNSQQGSIWPYETSFSYIPNPINPTQPNSTDEGYGLIHIGRLTEAKSVDVACRAALQTHLRLDIYGDGELSKALKEEFLGHGDIHFHGYVDEVWSSLGANRVLISSSLHEGDGRNIAEAVIRSQPLLLSDTPDHRRFNLPETNYFRSLDELVKKLDKHKSQSLHGLRPSARLAQAERENRDPSKIASLWKQLIDRL